MLTTALPPTRCAYCVSEIIADRNAHSQPSTSVLLKKLVFLLVRASPSCAVGFGYFCVPKNSLMSGASLPEACALASAGSSGNFVCVSRASAADVARSSTAAPVTAITESLSATLLILTSSPHFTATLCQG